MPHFIFDSDGNGRITAIYKDGVRQNGRVTLEMANGIARTYFSAAVRNLHLMQEDTDGAAEVAKAKAWEAEKERYTLQEFPTGALAYVLKPDAADGEPSHRICPTCYNEGHKSLLQVDRRGNGGERVECHRCAKKLTLAPFEEPRVSRSTTGYY